MTTPQHAPLPRASAPATGRFDEHRRKALQTLLLLASVVFPLVGVTLYLRDGGTPLALMVLLMSLLVWLLGWLNQRGHAVAAAHGLVLVTLTAATVSTVLTGGVRSAGVFGLMASMLLASTFLSRGKMLAVVLFGITLLAVVNLLEQRGLLPGRLPPTTWGVWVIQTAVIAMLLISALTGQHRLREAFNRQAEALAVAEAAQAAQRDSQERFMALFRSNPVACLVQSIDRGVIVDCNQAFCKLSGYSRDELLDTELPPMWVEPAERQAFRTHIESSGHVQGMAAKGQRRDGSVYDTQIHAEVVQHGDERLLLTMVLDVSAETASRVALEKSRERFSKAFNFSPLGMTITRMSDGRFIEVNPANERVLGYTQADFAGKTATEAGVWLSEADREHYASTLRREGRLVGYETRMRAKSGNVVDVRIWAEMIDIEGEDCALSFTLNVAAEKQREAMLLTVAEGVSGETGEAFFRSLAEQLAKVIGADGVVIGELDHARRLNTLSLLWSGAQQPNHNCDISFTLCDQALTQPEMLLFENPAPGPMLLKPPFSDVDLSVFVGLPLRDADGSPVGLLSAVWRERPQLQPDLQALLTIFASRCNAELLRLRRDREILQLQSTLEQRVHERTEQLEYLNRELDSFAYTVSHDLKSPLRSIDGFSHLLREQMDERMNDDDRDLFNRIDASVQRMSSLITDLLSLARVSQGSLQRMDVNLSELAEDVIRQERHRDPARAVQVKIEPGLMANCDARMAQIVLENLLGNAWKYTRHQAAATIEFGKALRPPGQPAVFLVRDNGAGFDMARAERLFKPFNRLHAASEFEGSGVGLATVRRILERHGGHIRGEGEVGKGSVFEFSFGSGD